MESRYETEPEAVNMTSGPDVADKLRVSRRQLPITLLVGLLLAFVSYGYFSRYCSDALFSSDSADYVRGAKIGFAASYFDTHSVGLWGSLKIMKEYPEARLHLWDFLEQQNDAAPNRHWHVAPGLYGAAIASQFGADSRTYRLMMAAAGAVVVGIVFIGLRLAGVHFLLALATAILATLSPAVVYASATVTPHAPFLAALIASGFAFAQYLDRGNRAWGIATGVALGFAVAFCELSVVICAAFGVVLVWHAFRSGIKSAIHLLAVPAVALLGTAALLWPGGVLRGGYGLSYGVWCVSALVRRSKDFGDASLGVILTRGAQGSVVVILLLAVIAVGALVLELTRKSSLHIQVFSWLFLGFFAQGLLNRFKNPTYVSHFAVVTWVLLALLCQQWLKLARGRTRYGVVAAVCGMYLLLAIPAYRWPVAAGRAIEDQRTLSARAQEAIGMANRMIPQGATILGNYDYEIWHLYLPRNDVKHSTSASTLEPRPWVKAPGDYWIIADPQWLTSDWRGHLSDLSPSNSAGGFVIAHVGVPTADQFKLPRPEPGL